MQKRSLKPIILSALLAASFGATTVGTTFALFTDRADTKIEVTAGVVDVNLPLSEWNTYSAEENENGDRVDENGAKYISKANETKGQFVNGGTAEVVSGNLELKKLTPGDRITLNFASANASNVAIKYRLRYYVVEDNANESNSLARGLVTTLKIGNGEAKTFSGLLNYQTDWKLIDAGAAVDSIALDIELPIAKGNIYQKATAKFMVAIEAVQGNGHVEGEEAYNVALEEGATQAEVSNAISAATTGDAVTLPSGTFTIPANTASGVKIVADDPTETTVDIANLNNKSGNYTVDVEGVSLTNSNSGQAGVVYGSMKDGHFKNVIIDSRKSGKSNALRNLNVSGDLLIEDSYIYGEVYGIHDDAASGTITIKNSEIYGWNSFGHTITKVTFDGCSLKKSSYGSIRFYQEGHIDNCTFSEDYVFVDIAEDNVDAYITNSPTLPNSKLAFNGTITNSHFYVNGELVEDVQSH